MSRLQRLGDTLVDRRPPYCAGTMPIHADELVLYYGKGRDSKRIDFVDASNEDLEYLSAACDPATFGLDQKDVLDENYRKAGKLDSVHFSTKLDVGNDLMDCIRFDLLLGNQGRRHIKAELYKLNVYGKNSFFKAHKDTPRSREMFGSLVVVLPARHEGGALLLRHGGAEWTFDTASAITKHTAQNPHIAYAAFFSNVEHEVATVTSGHRVTITYNLYFNDKEMDKKAHLLKSLPPIESDFSSVLQDLLSDATFLPDGGYIGFGLNHEYPTETKPDKTKTLDYLKNCLKGSDAVVLKVCQDQRLHTTVQMFYEDQDYGLLIRKEPDIDGEVYDEKELWWSLWKDQGAKLVEKPKWADADIDLDFEVLWVTEITPFNRVEAAYGAYGNEPTTAFVYGKFCIIVHIGPAGKRATAGPMVFLIDAWSQSGYSLGNLELEA